MKAFLSPARVMRGSNAIFIGAKNFSNEVCRYEGNMRFVSVIFVVLVLQHVNNTWTQEPAWVPQNRQEPLVSARNRTTHSRSLSS